MARSCHGRQELPWDAPRREVLHIIRLISGMWRLPKPLQCCRRVSFRINMSIERGAWSFAATFICNTYSWEIYQDTLFFIEFTADLTLFYDGTHQMQWVQQLTHIFQHWVSWAGQAQGSLYGMFYTTSVSTSSVLHTGKSKLDWWGRMGAGYLASGWKCIAEKYHSVCQKMVSLLPERYLATMVC